MCAVLERRGQARRRTSDVETVSLDPRDLGEIEESIRTLARHLGAAGPGELLAQDMHHRIDVVHQLVRGLPRPRVFVAEWLDPPFAAGHWVPEMVEPRRRRRGARPAARALVRDDLGRGRATPRRSSIVLAPCGFDLERTVSEAGSVPPMGARVVAVDGDAAYSRPGPRVAEGVAQLAHLLHPDEVPAPALPSRELSLTRGSARFCHARTVTVLAAPVSQPVAPATSTLTGHSVLGTPITARRLGNVGDGPTVLVIGAIHGNERAGIAIVRRLAHDAESRRVRLWVIADLNPDGARAQHARQRARRRPQPQLRLALAAAHGARHDVLRRAPARSRSPRAASRGCVILRLRPDITIWFHQSETAVDISSGSTPIEARFARRVALPLRRLVRYPGSATTWQAHRFPKATAFVVELPPGTLERARDARVRASGARSRQRETRGLIQCLPASKYWRQVPHEDAGRAGDGRAAARCARHHVPLPARDRCRRGPHAHRALDPRHHLAPRLAAADRARRDRARQPDDALPHRRPARRGAADQPRGRRRRPPRRARRGDGRRPARCTSASARSARASLAAHLDELSDDDVQALLAALPALEALAEGLRRDAPGPSAGHRT